MIRVVNQRSWPGEGVIVYWVGIVLFETHYRPIEVSDSPIGDNTYTAVEFTTNIISQGYSPNTNIYRVCDLPLWDEVENRRYTLTMAENFIRDHIAPILVMSIDGNGT